MSAIKKIGKLNGSVIVGDLADVYPENYAADLIEEHVASLLPPVSGVDLSEPLSSRMRVWDAVIAQQRSGFVARNGHAFGVVNRVEKVESARSHSGSMFAASSFVPLF